MPETITRWILGKDVTSLIIAGVTVANDGTPTVSTANQFFGLLQQVRFIQRSTNENISPMDRPFENNVGVEKATDMEVTELMRYTAGRLARAIANNFEYARVIAVQAGQTITYWGKIDNNDETWAKGANTGVLRLVMCDVNQANPTFV